MQLNKTVYHLILIVTAASLFASCSFHRKKYENPITKDTLQPDKVLFDKAIGDIEHGRYEVARLTLNTLINTYDTSEYLAKAKLAVADSWYREGGAHGLAQAEAEYKDFILFYPNMEESAESQWRVCQIHYKQMEKADRDATQAQRAEDECRQLVNQFPNSKYLAQAQQMLRNTQEVLADKEFRTGAFYHNKGAYPAAANRLSFVADQYPLYSAADESLWELADSYQRMGDRFEDKAAIAYTRIVRDYPLSDHVDEAKEKLEAMKRPVPPADPAALARMQYEADNREKASMFSRSLGIFKSHPDVRAAAKSGPPAMQSLRPPVPVSVPPAAAGAAVGSDVTVQQVTNTSEIDTKPEARQNPGVGGAGATTTPAESTTPASGTDVAAKPAPTAQEQAPLPSNRQPVKPPKQKKKKAPKKTEPDSQAKKSESDSQTKKSDTDAKQ